MFRSCAVLCLLCFVVLAQEDGGSSVIQIHGSGSSASRRCFWYVMEQLAGQTKLVTRGTYRSTGSGTGAKEFVGNISYPYNDFGSADYPLPKENFDELTDAAIEMVHLPVVMGAVAVFHSIPVVKDTVGIDFNLTSCLVARIFQGEIEDWTHPDIMAINPSFEIPEQLDFYGNPVKDPSFPIKVAHRSDSSGTTNTFTSYLYKVCPDHWSEDLFASNPIWPMTGNERLIGAGGTDGMISLLLSEEWVIGYADAGSALSEGLREIALKVEGADLRSDFFLTAENSLRKDGVAAALISEGTNIPASGDADWSGVDPVNQVAGYIYAWPMSALTYAYVRKDLTFMKDPRSQSFLKAFLRAMYDPEYIGKCEESFGFLSIKDDLRAQALESIDMLRVSPDAPEWVTETDEALADGEGQGEYVISTRRQVSSMSEQEILKGRVDRSEVALDDAIELLDGIQSKSEDLFAQVETVTAELQSEQDSIFQELSKRVDMAFIMSIVALSIGGLLAILVICRQEQRIRKLEKLPAQVLRGKPAKKKSRTPATQEEEEEDN